MLGKFKKTWKNKKNTVIASLSAKQSKEELSQYLVVVIVALIQKHKLPWKFEKRKKWYQVRDKWGKFILNHTEVKVVEEILTISKQLWKRWEDEFPDDISKITKVWDLIEKEDSEIEVALRLQDRNRFHHLIIK